MGSRIGSFVRTSTILEDAFATVLCFTVGSLVDDKENVASNTIQWRHRTFSSHRCTDQDGGSCLNSAMRRTAGLQELTSCKGDDNDHWQANRVGLVVGHLLLLEKA